MIQTAQRERSRIGLSRGRRRRIGAVERIVNRTAVILERDDAVRDSDRRRGLGDGNISLSNIAGDIDSAVRQLGICL